MTNLDIANRFFNVACIVFTLDGQGRISRLEEYLDSAQVAALRS